MRWVSKPNLFLWPTLLDKLWICGTPGVVGFPSAEHFLIMPLLKILYWCKYSLTVNAIKDC